MFAAKHCLRCGQDMRGRTSHICPGCGRFFAAYTPATFAMMFAASAVFAVFAVAALTIALWIFA
jgi:hypothetical protein